MSQFPIAPPLASPATSGSRGLAITSLVLGIVALAGSCILSLLMAPLALAAIVTGTISLAKRRGGMGLAIAGLVCGVFSLPLGVVTAGVMLPALAKARQSARQIKSGTQMRNIGQALLAYAASNQNQLPESATGWEQRLIPYGISGDILVSPNADEGQVSYIYVPGADPARDSPITIILYENPQIRASYCNVVYLDGRVDAFPREELAAMLAGKQQPAPRLRP